jgi:hypothetical protein
MKTNNGFFKLHNGIQPRLQPRLHNGTQMTRIMRILTDFFNRRLEIRQYPHNPCYLRSIVQTWATKVLMVLMFGFCCETGFGQYDIEYVVYELYITATNSYSFALNSVTINGQAINGIYSNGKTHYEIPTLDIPYVTIHYTVPNYVPHTIFHFPLSTAISYNSMNNLACYTSSYSGAAIEMKPKTLDFSPIFDIYKLYSDTYSAIIAPRGLTHYKWQYKVEGDANWTTLPNYNIYYQNHARRNSTVTTLWLH